MSQSRMAVITFVDGPAGAVDPGYGVGGWGGHPSTGPVWGGHPDNSLPGYGHPSHPLPGGGHISLLPVFPFDPTRPDNSLPGSQPGVDNSLPGSSARPDNELPRPGKRYVVKWLCGSGLILVPDNELPATPEPK